MSWRPPTPPILHDPIVNEDDETPNHWYYGERAGGYVLTFGKFLGQQIHKTSLSYLYWCDRTFTNRNLSFIKAFHKFHDGLEEYAQENYGDFRVPFGRKHQGKRISECRDKEWLLWASGKGELRKKYKVFFTAVELWLANPRHQGVKRDIGELLQATEYDDDLDLKRENEEYEYDDDEPTQSDLEFINDEDEDLADGEGQDLTDHEIPEQSNGSQSANSDVSLTSGTDDQSRKASRSPEPERQTKTPKKKKKASQSVGDDFIEKDEEDNGSDDYEPRDSEPTVQNQNSTRETRSSAKKKGLVRRNVVDSPSPTMRRQVRSDMLPTLQSPRKRPQWYIIQSPPESEGEIGDEEQTSEPHIQSGSKSPTIQSDKHGMQSLKATSSPKAEVPTIMRHQPKRKARGDHDVAFHTRMIAEYFENAQRPLKLPSEVRCALDTVVSYVKQQQCTDIASDADAEREVAVVELAPSSKSKRGSAKSSKQMRGRSSQRRPRSSDEYEPDEVSDRHATPAATPVRKKTRVAKSSPDPSPSKRVPRSEVEPHRSCPRPYVLLTPRRRRASDIE